MSAQDGSPLRDILTLVITTSPTPSAPSTDLISSILDSFKLHCSGLLSCRVTVVFDTYDRISESMRLKKGQVTHALAQAHELYKANVKGLILKEWCARVNQDSSLVFRRENALAEYGSPHLAENHVVLSISQTHDKRITFIEPVARLGFGLAVRSALRITETPYVWVQQHDWPLVRDIPLDSLLEVMQASEAEGSSAPPVKYVCLPAIRMVSYATSPHVQPFPALRTLTAQLKRDFVPASRPDVAVPLTPLFFWHDKPHIAFTAHYLARIFPSRLAIARGDFIEDHVGQRARAQMKEGNWVKWACWLYYPEDGREICLKHRNGRKWKGVEAEQQVKEMFLGREMRKHDSLSPVS
ncbi:hypothetical protein F5B22DRAFT_592637 [Xylaria bambusicola]|uniref:uncharacterized protein n=1 Tax=Xylaria bambusicola TaxID=326684 RepID=UPI002008D41E|nr:uncharacterized protein F5B22DRAFT_592637 [Xylaria bambusicola]KAI0522047.1 hypothetical protein F5B22DRAFT_592637 [Xylaria bambusicola]